METSLNAGAVFFGLVAWSTVPFLLREKCKTTSSAGYVRVQCCTVSLWMCLCKHPLLMEQLYSALLSCTKASRSYMPALIHFDFMVSCHFKRSLLIDIYWWPVINFISSRSWGLSYTGSPLCSVLHKYMVSDRYCPRELKSI